ncbi:Putative pentatricopeptide repeat-containing protein [Apostasia shenzhenica]|uniref:Pentatricopeptide repeat-containing protein n=1 Tax=Apostasia shenzhenica TaxID=1088818 RepID=A0A2I0AGD3_9ASPA|nr:Putative pentatricopeptide repeat-containing protein [Apostasia shenzhenica]
MPLHAFPAPKTSRHALCNLLLSLSASRDLTRGQQLHAHLLKSGIVPSLSTSSSLFLLSTHLITFYSRCSLPLLSLRAFRDLPYPSPSSWSALISSLSQNELPDLAFLCFRSMLAAGLPPCDRTLPSAAKSLAALSLPIPAASLHSLALKSSLAPQDVFAASSLLDMYAKCGLLPDAHRLFDEMPNRNVVSWSALIYGYAQVPGLETQALKLFRSSVTAEDCAGGGVNDFSLSCIIRVCAAATLLELGSQIHARCFKSGYDASPFVGSSLVSLYSKCGLVEIAYQVFEEMPERNLGAWNAVLMASAQHGHTVLAFERFRQMERHCRHQPNFITFLCLLTACSHAGLVDEGRRYFALMTDYGVDPGSEHYAAMVDILGRAGKLREAVAFIETMPMPPTESVWGSLLTGCRLHGDTETAAYAADKVFEMGCEGSGAHMLLTNAYATAGRYVEAARARKAMRDRGVRKETGLSWLELDGGTVNTFVSGDRSHRRSGEIYEVLEKVGEKMEAMGYVVDTSWVGKDVDGEEKKRSVGYHSERLAIGLGLLEIAPPRPIRVMKNLRVCGDCHTAIKCLTKCTGRVVILRDNRRFHHFQDGICSCGDYW